MLYFSQNLDEQHVVLKFITMFCAIALLLIIPKVAIDYPSNCSLVVSTQNITSTVISPTVTSTVSSLGYTTYCGTAKNGATILLQGQMIFLVILIGYIFFYLCWMVFQYIMKRKRL